LKQSDAKWKGCAVNLLLDLDDTTSDARWREPMIASEGWDRYHEQLINDKPIYPIASMVNALWLGQYYIVALTARPERYRTITMQWLVRNCIRVDELLMRGNKDYRPSPAVKLALVERRFPATPKTSFIVLDDREDVCAAFKAAGYVTLQIHRSVVHETTSGPDT
jgi:hypothetical protein